VTNLAQRMTTPVLGREVELATSRRFLDRVPSGFAALVLQGPPGIGKTALWREVVEMARQRRWAVLSAHLVSAEAPLLFSGLTDLLGQVTDQDFSALPLVQRRALEVALLLTEPGEAPVDPRTLSSAVLSVLRQMASLQPVLLAIDDVQWVDRPTAGCLSFALRRTGALPIGLLASARSGAGALPVLGALGSEEVEELAVGPLPPGEIEAMLLQRTPGLQRRAIVRVAKQSGGNPFYALEIARAVATLGGNSGPGRRC
jgi:predicted ATPase